MTTNAIDKLKMIAASDTRWSKEIDADHLAYVDDTAFDKITSRTTSCIICAGDALLIQYWRAWFLQPTLDFVNTPPLNRYQGGEAFDIVFNVVTTMGIAYHTTGDNTITYKDEAKFAGSGRMVAHDCYADNKCVKKAVETAIDSQDDFTGGSLVYVELLTGQSNLNGHAATLADAEKALLLKGKVMNRNTREIHDFADFMSKQQAAAPGSPSITAGLSAPTGAPAFIWSEDDKAELMKAFKLVVALEEKATNDK